MTEDEAANIVDAVITLAVSFAPDVTLVPKYGGTVFEVIKDDPKSQVGGVFVSKNHVSVEFSKGVAFDDPDKILEGKGKFRRHVKLESLNDIEAKSCAFFLKQAISSA